MKTIVIVGGIVLTGATLIAVMMNNRDQVPSNPQPVQTEATNGSMPGEGSGPQKLNPAHGQPGHRCDLAVGAPLPESGGTAKPTNTDASAVPQQIPMQQAPPSSQKLNPAHGQPGHRCDLQVGAPLT